MTDMRAAERDALAHLVPTVGSTWVWNPTGRDGGTLVIITQTRWNGEEWWIGSRNVGPNDVPSEREDWNELYRWMESCVLFPLPDGTEA